MIISYQLQDRFKSLTNYPIFDNLVFEKKITNIIDDQNQTYCDRELGVFNFLQVLNNGFSKNYISIIPNYLFYSVLAYERGAIKDYQIATLFYHNSIAHNSIINNCKEPKLYSIAEDNDGSNIIKEQLGQMLTEDEVIHFFRLLRKLPISEQCFTYKEEENKNYNFDDITGETSFMDFLANEKNFNIFNIKIMQDNKIHIYPSIGMILIFLQIKAPHIIINLKFGLCVKNTDKIAKGSIDVYVPNIYNKLEVNHEFSNDYMHYMLYNCFMYGSIPNTHKSLLLEISNIFKTIIYEMNDMFFARLQIIHSNLQSIEYTKPTHNLSEEDKCNLPFWSTLLTSHLEAIELNKNEYSIAFNASNFFTNQIQSAYFSVFKHCFVATEIAKIARINLNYIFNSAKFTNSHNREYHDTTLQIIQNAAKNVINEHATNVT